MCNLALQPLKTFYLLYHSAKPPNLSRKLLITLRDSHLYSHVNFDHVILQDHVIDFKIIFPLPECLWPAILIGVTYFEELVPWSYAVLWSLGLAKSCDKLKLFAIPYCLWGADLPGCWINLKGYYSSSYPTNWSRGFSISRGRPKPLISTISMITCKMVTFHDRLSLKNSFEPLITWPCEITWQISTDTLPVDSKRSRIVTYFDGLPPLKPEEFLITWPTWGHMAFWKIYISRNTCSSQHLGLLNLAGCWLQGGASARKRFICHRLLAFLFSSCHPIWMD